MGDESCVSPDTDSKEKNCCAFFCGQMFLFRVHSVCAIHFIFFITLKTGRLGRLTVEVSHYLSCVLLQFSVFAAAPKIRYACVQHHILWRNQCSLQHTQAYCRVPADCPDYEQFRGDEYGICWSAVGLTASRDVANFTYSKDSKDVSHSALYSGTPRLLLFGSDDKALSKAKIDKSQVSVPMPVHLLV